MILGIDTSLGTSVAIIDDDGVIRAQADSTDPLGHAEVVGTLLQQVCAEVPESDELTCVAAGMGPGLFTGLRIGIAAARAFALGRGIPVVSVVSHDAIALETLLHDALTQTTDATRFAVVTDARRREDAYSVYDGLDDDGLPVRVTGPALAPRDEIDEVLAGLGARRHDARTASAAMLALVAARARAAGREIGPRDALYLRSPDVAVPSAPKRVAS
ncbi:tRNA (adenosine(37)-N6)-threonylcarbamoyltransferase complex dimerization subunit type 1 TsaB [Microbacterium luticocti]|uniref:tRNA (adenosine(37)-N6)-threonylcarbamoyltransferase complex dimerization subunit type 1 TsaB n=1 Tax=Microbacterium luticocti TaxID=451764 RepID=UPI0004191FC6|nr:tRNA (adenosine(37)-N6)-threonylcarbamoyltransferase complex dimerization subunit type 1 TsaB [Microbacterium luticocti]